MEFFLSRNTIKSQAISIYQKLRASSRSQAVALSRQLGLLEADHPVVHPSEDERQTQGRLQS